MHHWLMQLNLFKKKFTSFVLYIYFFIYLFIYLSIYVDFYDAFNTVQVISQQVVLWAEETSTYSWSRFGTVYCQSLVSNYQLSHIRSGV